MKLVHDWKDAPKWLSVQIMVLLAALPVVWAMLPPDVKSYVPAEWKPWIFSAIAIGGIVGRLKDQGK